MRDEKRKDIIEIWKTVVEVQQHFNDIEMRIRSIFVTVLLALFASIGFLYEKHLSLDIGKLSIQFSTLLPLFGIFGAYLFYFIDRHWYHRLLLGAVLHGLEIERKYKRELPELSLSDAIGAQSPVEPKGVTWILAKLLVREERFKKTGKIHTDGKIELFYKSVAWILFFTFVLLAALGGVSWGPKPNWLLYLNQ